MEEQDRLATIEEAIEKADYFANIACRAILTSLENGNTVDKYTRKIILDSVNDFKRNIIRYIYGAF